MKTREEVEKFANLQLEENTYHKTAFHYGRCELQELFDFIYTDLTQRYLTLDNDPEGSTPYLKDDNYSSSEKGICP